ncbi:MAG: alpha/beta fold hydrolase [Candidatus Hodarchaeota archaeon]
MLNIIFIHGLESSGKGFKGKLLRKCLPECIAPDFKEYNPNVSVNSLLEIRMEQLFSILKEKSPWIIIGSSFGGLMGTLFTCQNPEKVLKLILLAPYLSHPKLNPELYSKVNVPVVVYHGKDDKIVSLNQSRAIAEKLFKDLKYNVVEDNHSLHKTVVNLDWKNLII